MKFKVKHVIAAALIGISGLANAATVSINFDGTGAPGGFSQTTPLTSFYSAQGVSFSGANGLSGSILNQSGNFGFNARSGTDFFAYNTSLTGSIFDLVFSSALTSVSIWAASRTQSTYTLQAFDTANNLVATDSLLASVAWQELDVAGAGITRVRLNAGGNSSGAFDDLSFATGSNSVPEPGTLMLIAAALAGIGAIRRRNA